MGLRRRSRAAGVTFSRSRHRARSPEKWRQLINFAGVIMTPAGIFAGATVTPANFFRWRICWRRRHDASFNDMLARMWVGEIVWEIQIRSNAGGRDRLGDLKLLARGSL